MKEDQIKNKGGIWSWDDVFEEPGLLCPSADVLKHSVFDTFPFGTFLHAGCLLFKESQGFVSIVVGD